MVAVCGLPLRTLGTLQKFFRTRAEHVFSFVAEHGSKIITLLEILQTQSKPIGHKVFDSLIDFQVTL